MTFKPHPFQHKDLATLSENNYTGLLAIQPGGGKTYLSLFAARDSNASQTLVIAPKSTFATAWQKSTPNVLEHGARVIGNGTKAERQALSDLEWGLPGVFLVSPQLFTRADISMWRPDLLVCDEVHQINKAGGKGQRKLSGFSAKDDPISKQVGASLSLSGTPARSSFERMWAINRLHWPELYRRGEVAYDNYFGWLAGRMTSKEIITGRDQNGALKKARLWLAERDEGRLFREMPCVIQHFRREECCEFHPEGFLLNEEPNPVKRVVELTPKQKRVIKELENQGLAWIDDQPFVVDLPMTIKQRIRQVTLGEPEIRFTGEYDEFGVEKTTLRYDPECKSPALDELFNILEQLGDEPVIIYMASQQFAEVVTKRLVSAGISAFEYSGKTTKTRDADLAQFGTKYRVCVGIVSAIGTGTDSLQDVCNNEVWMEVPLDDVDTQQTLARLDRLGQTKQVQQFWIHDELGYSQGMYDTKLTKRLELAKSTRLEV